MPASSLRLRKQPTQPRAVETVAAILEAAALILEAEGVERFNTNAVAERAGASIGSLYQYFPGKAALLVALMRREKQRFGDDARKALAAPTGRAALRRFLAAAVRQQFERPELARLLDVEEAQRPETRPEVDGASDFEATLRAILARPDLPPQPDAEVAIHELGLLVRTLVDAAGVRRAGDPAGVEARLAGAVFGYLEARADAGK
jgi:AcrR family transcriptional regulator